MSRTPTNGFQVDIPFNDSDFRSLASLAKEKFGLNLSESKKPLVYSRLSKRLKARNVSGFREYMSLLKKPEEEMENFELISALTTNVTSFFREAHHFEYLKNDLTSNLISRSKTSERLRIWSAGCSAGPEPYSVAMTLLSVLPDAARYDIKILATDIDPKILDQARKGMYPITDLDGIPEGFRLKWAKSVKDEKFFQISQELKNLITFNELNLISPWPFKGPFDVIFCRNVAIYFDQETQKKLWDRFCEMLNPGGLLFIGHSERVTGPAANKLEGVDITSYRKISQSKRNS